VTEGVSIFVIDLVEQMIRIAAKNGEKLDRLPKMRRQADRVCARFGKTGCMPKNPNRGVLPSIGVLTRYRPLYKALSSPLLENG